MTYSNGITIMSNVTTEPVSYTHLDVYKRQANTPTARILVKELIRKNQYHSDI